MDTERSKNRKTDTEIARIVRHSLGQDVREGSVRELTAGQCNALYDLTLEDGRRCVLKLASPDMTGLRRGERWLMESEVSAMRLVRERLPELPVPAVLCYDRSLEAADAPYFIMEYMDGELMGGMRRSWTEEDKAYWYRQIGQLIRRYTSVRGPSFGIVASGREFASFYDFYRDMLDMMLRDAVDFGVDLGVPPERIMERLPAGKWAFDEVTEPRLVHYDLWENNLLVKDGRISGILDWERAIYADPLMEERFLHYCRHPAILEGYGQTTFSEAERERMAWYDLLMDAALMVDVFTRQYADDGQYRWAKKGFAAVWESMRK